MMLGIVSMIVNIKSFNPDMISDEGKFINYWEFCIRTLWEIDQNIEFVKALLVRLN